MGFLEAQSSAILRLIFVQDKGGEEKKREKERKERKKEEEGKKG